MNKCMETGGKIIIEEPIPKVQNCKIDDVLIKAGEARTQRCMTCWKAGWSHACRHTAQLWWSLARSNTARARVGGGELQHGVELNGDSRCGSGNQRAW
jgi:hypothetical protein